jgi:uncharacterized RDD family membrane protein YckC
MICQKCGALNPDAEKVCSKCGALAGAGLPAGFWLRLVAFVIDSIILAVVFMGIIWSWDYFSGLASKIEKMIGLAAVVRVYSIILVIFNWLYFAIQESSGKQGTLGKMMVGIKVTDLNGNRISFGRATGRLFAKNVSMAILFIGFIMAGLTRTKQSLHDMMAGTWVVKK